MSDSSAYQAMFADICNAVNAGRILWKKHALERMMERGISRTQVKQAILQGSIIEYYPDDYPISSVLLVTSEPEPLYAVVAYNSASQQCHVITSYRPRFNLFSSRFNYPEIIMKEQQSLLCPVCHGGHKQPGMTTFTVELGFGVVVVRDVPAQVCDLCGTDWLEDSVTEKLELIVEQARQKHPVVEVVLWQQETQALSS